MGRYEVVVLTGWAADRSQGQLRSVRRYVVVVVVVVVVIVIVVIVVVVIVVVDGD